MLRHWIATGAVVVGMDVRLLVIVSDELRVAMRG